MTRRAFCALLIVVAGALADEEEDDDDGVRLGKVYACIKQGGRRDNGSYRL